MKVIREQPGQLPNEKGGTNLSVTAL